MQGLFEWLYGLFLNCISFTANALIGVMSTDLTFFEESAPIVLELYDVFTAVGWAILLGNLVFQALKGMMAGLGFEVESPASLLARSGVYGFLLLASKPICEMGLGLGEKIINLMGIPTFITLNTPDASLFTVLGDSSWVIVIIVGTVLGFQLIKLFFEIGERYVVVCVLTLLAPLGFAMGGSKATKDIATGYIRMFASMVVMMILNVLFLKLVLSALATMPTTEMVIPWCVLVVALARTARKVDNLIARIGLNPAITGDPLSRKGGAMTLMMLAARSAVKGSAAKAKIGKTSSSTGKSSGIKSGTKGANKPSYNTVNQQSNSSNQTQAQNSADNQSSQTTNNSQNNAQTANGGTGGQNTRFGSQRSSVNNTAGKNNQTAKNGGQQSSNTINGGNNVGGDNMQQLNNQQKSSSNTNSKTNQGGSNMNNKQGGASAKDGSRQQSPTQINTNRFGSNNISGKNTNTANMSNNATDMSTSKAGTTPGLGQTNNMANMQTNTQKTSQPGNMSMSQKNINAPQSSVNPASAQKGAENQGRNVKAQKIADNLKAKGNNSGGVNQGKNSLSANQGKNPQSAANQGKNNLSANQNKNPQSALNQGKNNLSANQNKNPQSAVNQGKNNLSANQSKNPQSAVNQGKNNLSANQSKNPQSAVNQGKNNFPANHNINPQTSVSNGKNDTKPIAAQNANIIETPPEPINNNEVETNG